MRPNDIFDLNREKKEKKHTRHMAIWRCERYMRIINIKLYYATARATCSRVLCECLMCEWCRHHSEAMSKKNWFCHYKLVCACLLAGWLAGWLPFFHFSLFWKCFWQQFSSRFLNFLYETSHFDCNSECWLDRVSHCSYFAKGIWHAKCFHTNHTGSRDIICFFFLLHFHLNLFRILVCFCFDCRLPPLSISI